MIDILKSELDVVYKNFWYDIGIKLQRHIKGIIQVLVLGNEVFIEKLNYQIVYSFDYRLKHNDILQHILNGLQYNIYKEVFKD